MNKAKLLIPAAVVAVVMTFGLTIASAQTDKGKEALDALTNRLNQATTAQEAEPIRQEANKLIAQKYERAPEARAAAVEKVKAFAGEKAEVNYLTAAPSTYREAVVAEFYQVGREVYEVDARTNTIIQVGVGATKQGEKPVEYDLTPRYSPEELEVIAKDFIAKQGVSIEGLTPDHGSKADTAYFFRFEDNSKKTDDGRDAFVQVGFTVGGSRLSYTNTLGL